MFEGNDSVVKAMQEVSNLSCDDCKHYNQRLKECVLGKHCKDARAVLFKAASKQIAFRPIFDSGMTWEMTGMFGVIHRVYGWKCPNCGEYYDYDVRHNVCPECGQKIEWGRTV